MLFILVEREKNCCSILFYRNNLFIFFFSSFVVGFFRKRSFKVVRRKYFNLEYLFVVGNGEWVVRLDFYFV